MTMPFFFTNRFFYESLSLVDYSYLVIEALKIYSLLLWQTEQNLKRPQ